MNNKGYRVKGRGFSLVELLVYLASMALVLTALAYVLSHTYTVYTGMVSAARADRAAGTLGQVLATELRSGVAIDQSESVFNSAQGQLAISAKEGTEDTEKVFRVEDNRVIFTADGDDTFMTPEDMQVSKLLFNQLSTSISYGVRYEIDITYSVRGQLVTKTYPGLVMLRYSYD